MAAPSKKNPAPTPEPAHRKALDLHSVIAEALGSAKPDATVQELAAIVTERLLPPKHLLVSFEAVTGHESADYESCQPGYDFTTLEKPAVVAHTLSTNELARLHFDTELQNLTESGVLTELEQVIEKFTFPEGHAFRENAKKMHNKIFFDRIGPA